MDFTAFTLASARNHFGIMKLLLEAGADTEFVDKMVRNQRVLDRQIKIQLDNQGFMFFFFL
jgi:ankyrin repeat protein